MATLLASSARSVDQTGSLASQLANCVDQEAGCLAGWPTCVAGQPGPGHVGGWAPSAWRAGPAPRSGKRRRAVAQRLLTERSESGVGVGVEFFQDPWENRTDEMSSWKNAKNSRLQQASSKEWL